MSLKISSLKNSFNFLDNLKENSSIIQPFQKFDPFYKIRKLESFSQINLTLQSIEETIKEEKVPEKPIAYFSAIFATLLSSKNSNNSTTHSLIQLLSIILPFIPQAIKIQKHKDIIDKMTEIIKSSSKNENVIHSSIKTILVLILSSPQIWSSSLIENIFDSFLEFSVHKKQQIRIITSHGFAKFLEKLSSFSKLDSNQNQNSNLNQNLNSTGIPINKNQNPESLDKLRTRISKKIHKFCTNIFEEKKTRKPNSFNLMIFSTQFLSFVLPHFPSDLSTKIVVQLITLLNTTQKSLILEILSTLIHFFKHKKSQIQTKDALIKSIMNLEIEKKKNPNITKKNCSLLTHFVSKLHSTNPLLSHKFVVQTLVQLSSILINENDHNLKFYISELMQKTIISCVDQDMIMEVSSQNTWLEQNNEQNENQMQISKRIESKQSTKPLLSIVKIIENGLTIKFQKEWEFFISIASSLFSIIGRKSYPVLNDLFIRISVMIFIQDKKINQKIKGFLATSIRAYGIAHFLNLIPLNFFNQNQLDWESDKNWKEYFENDKQNIFQNYNNEWIVEIIRDNIINDELGYFVDTFIPMLDSIQNKIEEKKVANIKDFLKAYRHIWSFLPGFFNFAIDFESSFPKIVDRLSNSLSSEPNIRIFICKSIQKVIKQNNIVISSSGKSIANDLQLNSFRINYTAKNAESVVKLLSHYSQHFLPLLLNLYCSSEIEEKESFSSAIQAYSSIADHTYINNLFKTVIKKLLESVQNWQSIEDEIQKENEQKNFGNLLDLSLILFPNLNDEHVIILFRVIKPHLDQTQNSLLQKKAFKVLQWICKCKFDLIKNDKTRFNDVISFLTDSFSQCSSPLKKRKIQILHYVLWNLDPKEITSIIGKLLVEIILSTKEINSKTRRVASTLLITIGNKFLNSQPQSAQQNQQENQMEEEKQDPKNTQTENTQLNSFFTMIMAGMTGVSNEMISASVSTTTSLLREFFPFLPSESIQNAISNVLLLLNHQSRQVLKSVLRFLKMVVMNLETVFIQPHLSSIFKTTMNWPKETQNHFRWLLMILFEKIISKFDYFELKKIFPSEHAKFFKNIHKSMKKKSQKQQNQPNAIEKKQQFRRPQKTLEDDKKEQNKIKGFYRKLDSMGFSFQNRNMIFTENEDEDPLDLLDQSSSKFFDSNPKNLSQKSLFNNNLNDNDNEDDQMIEFSKDGKIVVKEIKKLQTKNKEKSQQNYSSIEQENSREIKKGKISQQNLSNQKNSQQNRNKTEKEFPKKKSVEKRKGDSRKKGETIEPFEYIPLDGKQPKLGQKSKGKFDRFMKAARKGSNIGKKIRSKQRKRKQTD
ncbi:rrp12-like protein [Anaeramoeba ignava]|uniref:Rrp12-like protein n=1 Tax=Anaeramoeba ignava TaxID=1746090 RepID=A0A9Q0R606_ANAIG|nr:rrp12-like protein [Anaeramoeba ignava]